MGQRCFTIGGGIKGGNGYASWLVDLFHAFRGRFAQIDLIVFAGKRPFHCLVCQKLVTAYLSKNMLHQSLHPYELVTYLPSGRKIETKFDAVCRTGKFFAGLSHGAARTSGEVHTYSRSFVFVVA
jgi:hypothetical protein